MEFHTSHHNKIDITGIAPESISNKIKKITEFVIFCKNGILYMKSTMELWFNNRNVNIYSLLMYN